MDNLQTMRLIFLIVIVAVSMDANAKTKISKNLLIKDIEAIIDLEWKRTIEPGLPPPPSPDKPPGTVWQSRVTPPIPSEWPLNHNNVLFYAYARGINLNNLIDGEYVGGVWAKIAVSPKPKLSLITNKLVQTTEIVGVRPLKSSEVEILGTDPIELIRRKRNAESDKLLKAFYCLNESLGNIPNEVIERHSSFFSWLSCR